MKQQTIGTMNAIIFRINEMSIPQKKLMDRTSNWITELETKIEQLEQDFEDTLVSKIEEAVENLFEKDESFESKVHDTVKSLLDSEYFTYRLRSMAVGNPNVYVQITTPI